MAKHKRIGWERLPLLETWQEHADDRVVIDGTVTLLADGDVVINNRWFRGNWLGLFGSDAIDFAIPGGHAYRDKHSNRLVIRTGGPERQTLVFEYQRYGLVMSAAWYQLVQRVY